MSKYEIAYKRVVSAATQMREKRGPVYRKWLKGMKAWRARKK